MIVYSLFVIQINNCLSQNNKKLLIYNVAGLIMMVVEGI